MQLDVNWALFWVTLTLVGVTVFYAIQTWRLVKVPFTPRLIANLTTTTIREDRKHGLTILIKNIGNRDMKARGSIHLVLEHGTEGTMTHANTGKKHSP
jgi:hypothetical protein